MLAAVVQRSQSRGEGRPQAQQNYSTDSEDPWDFEPHLTASGTTVDDDDYAAANMRSSNNRPSQDDDDDALDDGDLPALTRNRSSASGRVVNGQQTTMRPLRAPSLFGDERLKQEQRQFWAQLEDDDDDDPAIEEHEQRSYGDEVAAELDVGPDDEMQPKQSTQNRELENVPRQDDEIEDYDGYTNASAEDQDMDFCGTALNVIGNMCGAGFALTGPTENDKGSYTPGKLTNIRPDREEEHTAIEVEFVEPVTVPPKKQRNEARAIEALPVEATNSDVYNSFSPSDKRKFVKLINSGMSPADASTQIKAGNDRESAKTKSSNKVIKKLAFWKKSPRSHQEWLQQEQAIRQESLVSRDDESDLHLQADSLDATDEIERQDTAEESGFVEAKTLDFTPPRAKDAFDSSVEKYASSPETDTSPEGRRFAKSGISYYDAVHERPEEDDEDDIDAPIPLRSFKLHGSVRATKAFSKFAERSKSAPRARLNDELTPEGHESFVQEPRDVESLNAGTLLLSEAQKQRELENEPSLSYRKSLSHESGASSEQKLLRSEELHVVSPDLARTMRQGNGRQAIQLGELDVSMSTYMHASEAYNNASGMSVGGQLHGGASVYTLGTNMTGMSAVTTSTRNRRPGAAKSRLEKERRAQQVCVHSKGWHETMKAVSASTNRRWDPVRGWIDFEDNNTVVEDSPADINKIHLNLEKSITRKKQLPGSSTLDQQLGGATSVQRAVESNPATAEPRLRKIISPGRSRDSSQSPGRAGWLQTMRDASVAMAPEGHHWDPEHGWTKSFTASTQELNMLTPTPKVNSEIPSVVSPESVEVSTSDSRDKKLNKWVARHKNSPESVDGPSIESSAKAVASNDESEYMQIEESGAVRAKRATGSHLLQSRAENLASSRVDANNSDKSGIETNVAHSNSFPSVERQDSPLLSRVTTHVVKQKIGEEDFNLFADSNRQLNVAHENESKVFHHEEARSAVSLPRHPEPYYADEIKPRLSREAEATSWEKNRLFPPDNSSEVSSSVVASSLGSKRVPKLKSSARDTSPLSRRRNNLVFNSLQRYGKQDIDNDSSWPSDDRDRSLTSDTPLEPALTVKATEKEKAEEAAREKHLVKERLKQWESRAGLSDNGTPENALASEEWKSFLGRKATKQQEATLKQVEKPEGKRHEMKTTPYDAILGHLSVQSGKGNSHTGRRAEVSSSLPVRKDYDTNSDFEQATSEYGPGAGENSSFFRRLVECTAPIRAECHTVGSNVQSTVKETMQEMKDNDSMPIAHLAFLRSNPHTQGVKTVGSSGRFVPPAFCGRQDNVVEEEDEDDDSVRERDQRTTRNIEIAKTSVQRAQSSHRASSRSRVTHVSGAGSSSVVSADGFGAKTAYLEALALKGAVAGSKHSSSRSRGTRSSVSSASSNASSAHSEKWKSFLEKKKMREGTSTGKSTSESDVSKAASRYASNKLEEIMKSNSTRPSSMQKEQQQHGSSTHTADELAAARVEAMMAALTSTNQSDAAEI